MSLLDGGEAQSNGNVPPALVVMVGLPGTGKSHLAREIARRVPVDIVETDDIRLRLAPRPEYTADENRQVFGAAHGQLASLLNRGRSVVFDATNIFESGRRTLYRLADRAGARLLIVRTVAPDEVVERRLRDRTTGADSADRSEAGWEVYIRMKAEFKEIQRPHLVVDTSMELEPAVREIAQFVRGRK
jgi:predicted kinase